MLFHLSSKKYFKANTPPIFIKYFLFKEKYLEFLFLIPFPIFGFRNATVPFKIERERERGGGGGGLPSLY
jgi:hypothetical protein